MAIQIKRIYEEPSTNDGRRVLVDRLWPRGVSKEAAQLDRWAKELAPSPELRQWFGHDPDRFEPFREQYLAELSDCPEAEAFAKAVKGQTLTLLYAARDPEHNHARVLKGFLESCQASTSEPTN